VSPEIERKFLVRSLPEGLLKHKDSRFIKQWYLFFGTTVERIRTVIAFPYFIPRASPEISAEPSYGRDGWRAFHDIKTRNSEEDWRSQKEETREIPMHVAIASLDGDFAWVTKVRYRIPHGKQTIEIDVFTKPALSGLVMLEVELVTAGERIVFPEGFDVVEVTKDPRFRNSNLAKLSSLKELRLEEI